MTTLLKLIGYLVATLVVVVGITLFAARFADGPWEIIAGGPFKTGTLQTTEPEWAFIKDYNTVEFQLVNPATSRTTWIAETDNRIFIPCGYMDTAWGRIWKQWPIQAQEDPRAILRVDDKLYERKLVRIKDDPALDVVLSELARKYFPDGGGMGTSSPRAAVENDSLWIFELVPR